MIYKLAVQENIEGWKMEKPWWEEREREREREREKRKEKRNHPRDGNLSASNPTRALDTFSGYHTEKKEI